MNNFEQTTISIGIDTGTHTGFAVWDNKGKIFLELKSYSIIEAIERFNFYNFNGDYKIKTVRIEDVRQNKPIFSYRLADSKSVRYSLSIAQRVGMVKRDCAIWEELMKNSGVNFQMVRPTKTTMTKLNSQTFKNITKYQERTNEHTRDAGMLVFGL